jgi:hypothetical protein
VSARHDRAAPVGRQFAGRHGLDVQMLLLTLSRSGARAAGRGTPSRKENGAAPTKGQPR